MCDANRGMHTAKSTFCGAVVSFPCHPLCHLAGRGGNPAFARLWIKGMLTPATTAAPKARSGVGNTPNTARAPCSRAPCSRARARIDSATSAALSSMLIAPRAMPSGIPTICHPIRAASSICSGVGVWRENQIAFSILAKRAFHPHALGMKEKTRISRVKMRVFCHEAVLTFDGFSVNLRVCDP